MKKMLYFTAKWCNYCEKMKPVIERIQTKMNKDIEFDIIDVEKNNDMAVQFNVKNLPTILLLKEGKEIGRMTGVHGEEILMQFMED